MSDEPTLLEQYYARLDTLRTELTECCGQPYALTALDDGCSDCIACSGCGGQYTLPMRGDRLTASKCSPTPPLESAPK